MFSVGIDLTEIPRIAQSIEQPRFIQRVFGAQELQELQNRHPQHYAAAFAAKEAFAKAIRTGIRGFALTEVQLLHDEQGAPYLHLSGKALHIAATRGFGRFCVSISHTDTLATAIVLAETQTDSVVHFSERRY